MATNDVTFDPNIEIKEEIEDEITTSALESAAKDTSTSVGQGCQDDKVKGNQSFLTENKLENQSSTEHPALFQCLLCGHQSADAESHVEHIESDHKSASQPSSKKTPDAGDEGVKEVKKEKVDTKEDLEAPTKKANVRIALLKDSIVKCQNCGDTFISTEYLQDHAKTCVPKPKTQDAKDHECEVCGRSFGWQHDLKRHMDATHFKLRPHQCSQCGKRFGLKHILKMHFDECHLKLRPFQCELCQNRFSRKSHLRVHIDVTHMKLKPFQCVICKMQFGYKSHMNMHIKKIHYEASK